MLIADSQAQRWIRPADAEADMGVEVAEVPSPSTTGGGLPSAVLGMQQRLHTTLGPLLADTAGRRVVVVSRLQDVPVANLATLGMLLQHSEGRGGTYVALDRPVRYIQRLLDKHHIPHRSLLTVDGVGGMAAENNEENTQGVVATPFSLSDALRALRDDPRLGDFVLVDNLSSLLNFLSASDVAALLTPLRALQGDPPARHLIVIASYHSALERTLADGWDATVEIKER